MVYNHVEITTRRANIISVLISMHVAQIALLSQLKGVYLYRVMDVITPFALLNTYVFIIRYVICTLMFFGFYQLSLSLDDK